MAKDSRCHAASFPFDSADLFPSVIASIRDGVFPSPFKVAPDHEAEGPEKMTPAKNAISGSVAEDSPPVSETSLSSDSVSYYLKLRQLDQRDADQLQQQPLPSPTPLTLEPPHRFTQHHESVDVTKLRQFDQHKQSGSVFQKLQLRQVAALSCLQRYCS
jgi:hypothetical protein